MKKIDYYILTKKYVLTKTYGQDWETHKFEDHFSSEFPRKYPLGPTDVFDDPEIFMPAIKSIVTNTKRSFINKISRPNYLVAYIVDELNSTLRKRLFVDGFMETKYKRIFLSEIGASAVAAYNRDNYKKPSIVAAVIGPIVELSLCFGGARIINHVIESDFRTELKSFEEDCKAILKRDLKECMNLEQMSESDSKDLKNIWVTTRNFEYVLASNNSTIDTVITNDFQPAYSVNFTQMTDLMNEEFSDILSKFSKQRKKK